MRSVLSKEIFYTCYSESFKYLMCSIFQCGQEFKLVLKNAFSLEEIAQDAGVIFSGGRPIGYAVFENGYILFGSHEDRFGFKVWKTAEEKSKGVISSSCSYPSLTEANIKEALKYINR